MNLAKVFITSFNDNCNNLNSLKMHDMHLPNCVLNTTLKQAARNCLVTETNNVEIWEKCTICLINEMVSPQRK